MFLWKKVGRTALSISYFIILFCLFAYVAMQGPIVIDRIGPSAQSILRNNLFPFTLSDLGLENNSTFALIEFYTQMMLGFLSSYLIANTFRKLFDLEMLVTLLITLIFLSPYYSPVLFGVHIINHGYAYPIFLLTLRFLLHGLVFKEFSAYIKFFLFATIAVIMRRHFVFLPVVGFVSVIYSLIFHSEAYFGKKIFLGLAFLASVLIPDLSEKYSNYLTIGQFTSIPFAGFQFAVTPIYVSTNQDVGLIENPAFTALFNTIRDTLSQEGLLYENVSQRTDTPLTFRFRSYFEAYEKIAYERLKPIVQAAAAQNPALVDQGLIALSLTLIYNNFSKYLLVYSHNIIYHMGGYFMAGLLLVIFITSFICHIQYLGRFSLVSLILSFMAFSNYILVALLEPVTQEYGFYTDSLIQALLFALIAYIFKFQEGKDKIEAEDGKSAWTSVKKPQGW